jgi:periplasmic protein TonB
MTSIDVASAGMVGLPDEGRREWRRWLMCGVIVVMAHVAVAAALVYTRDVDDDDFPSNGIVIDLAAMPLDPTDVPMPEVPPGPEQVAAEATPEVKPIEKPEEKVEEIVRAPDPEVAMMAEPPKPETPAEAQPPAPTTSAPQMPRQVVSNAVPNWKRQISLLLERNKRYPAAAERHRDVGVAQLAFTMDRQGHVMASRIVKSSGSTALDNEAMDLIKRVQPFPKPPSELSDGQLSFIVPLRFTDPHGK